MRRWNDFWTKERKIAFVETIKWAGIMTLFVSWPIVVSIVRGLLGV